MADSVHKDINGPIWPLGFIKVVSAGTPVSIMSLVTASVGSQAGSQVGSTDRSEYAARGCQLRFRGMKTNTHGMQNNSGNVYIIKKFGANGSRDDYGTIIDVLTAGAMIELPTKQAESNCINPYEYYIDADNANDGAIVDLMVSI